MDVAVTLVGGTGTRTVNTDCLGDFIFDGLHGNHAYTVKIDYPGYGKKELAVKTSTDVDMGEIFLDPV
jgi:hypothetical protein